MTLTPDRTIRGARAVSAAIAFLAQQGRAELYLARHHRATAERCECGHHWPCGIVSLAEVAARKAAADAERHAAALARCGAQSGSHRTPPTATAPAGGTS